ncbi:hypothetical protein TNCV_635221 [Trichonephila clavipes]|nr:hypothetical protein TNCV_635221 [Trichonephila clavipes]
MLKIPRVPVCVCGLGLLSKIKLLVQFCVVRAQVPSSGEETRSQNYMMAIGIHLCGRRDGVNPPNDGLSVEICPEAPTLLASPTVLPNEDSFSLSPSLIRRGWRESGVSARGVEGNNAQRSSDSVSRFHTTDVGSILGLGKINSSLLQWVEAGIEKNFDFDQSLEREQKPSVEETSFNLRRGSIFKLRSACVEVGTIDKYSACVEVGTNSV